MNALFSLALRAPCSDRDLSSNLGVYCPRFPLALVGVVVGAVVFVPLFILFALRDENLGKICGMTMDRQLVLLDECWIRTTLLSR